MAKLSAMASRVHAALTAHLVPMLAADAAMPDLTSAVAGITKGNLGKQKAAVWAKAKVLVKPVLAKDTAGPDDVAMRILDMIESQSPMEGEADPMADENAGMGGEPAAAPPMVKPDKPVTDPNAAVPPPKKPGEEEEAEDGDPEMMKMLTEKLGGDAEMAKACYDICMGGAKDAVVDPARTETPATTEPAEDEEAPMMKPAMDAAIKAAVTQSREDMRAEARAAQEARQAVRPWVGDVSAAFDSAGDIYKAALSALGVSTKGVHPSAYRTILEHLPKPGAHKLANDAALGARSSDAGGFAKRFPGAGRIKVMG